MKLKRIRQDEECGEGRDICIVRRRHLETEMVDQQGRLAAQISRILQVPPIG